MKINNIEIFVEKISGAGYLNFILLHNAGGNHLFFSHQIELLKRHGNVILIDLPGHSKSEGMSCYQMSDLSAIVSQVCLSLSLDQIGLVGLNNGADIAIDMALHDHLPIHHLILIDPPIFMDPSFISEIKNFIHQLQNQQHETFVTSLVDQLFILTDEKCKSIARNAFNRVDRKALCQIFEGLIHWDSHIAGKLHDIKHPTLCILTDEHHCTYAKLKREAPHFTIGKAIGSRCWATLEVPDQVNAMIERFLQLN